MLRIYASANIFRAELGDGQNFILIYGEDVVETNARWTPPTRGEAEGGDGNTKSRLSYKDYNSLGKWVSRPI